MVRYIDADKLLAAYDAAHKGPPGGARKLIEDAPTADVQEVRHGHWKQYPDCGIMRCSNCDWIILEAYYSDFCPHCGAKMDRKEETCNDAERKID